ncbi:MAG: fibronectin type III domain-containing protein [Ruminococcus sp.]|nr:fibronectin type III domain-containing protein [Ruminococcus sp.]
MIKYLKRGLSAVLAAVVTASSAQFNVLYSWADELVEELTAEISDGDANGDGKVNSADVKKVQELIGSSVDTVKASALSACNVYRDDVIDVKDLVAVREIANGKKPEIPDEAASSNTCILDITDAECCPGEQVKIDVNILDWDQEIGGVELTMDFDASLELADISCKGDYQYVSDGNELKLFGITSMADVYRGTVATLTFNVPDTAYGNYAVKINSSAVYDNEFRSFGVSSETGVIAADVTERPLYLSPSYTNSKSMRLSWSMPYCSGKLEGFVVYRDGVEIARTADMWYYDKNLVTDQKYEYSVQAYGADNYFSAKSKTITAAPEAPVISAMTFPDNAEEIGGKSTYLKCSLEKTVDAKSYSLTYTDNEGEIQTIYSSENLAFSAVDIKWNIKNIPSGEYELTFTVTDKDGASAEKTASVNVDTTPPEEIFQFEVLEGEEQTQLTWSIAAEAKVTGYNIYRRTADTAYTLLKHIDGRETVEYTDKNLEKGDVYFYMICAVDKYGQEGIYSDEKSAAVNGDETSPEMTLFLPQSGNMLNKTVTLSLKASDNIGVSSIAAFVSEDDGETWKKLFEGKGASVDYRFDTSVYDEAEIKIKAVAYDYAGNESKALVHIYAIDNLGPAVVEDIQSVAVAAVTATISWSDVPDKDFSHFRVKYHKTDSTDVSYVTVYDTLGVNLSNLEPDTEYTLFVTAVDQRGNEGKYSEPFVFKTASDTIAPVITSIAPKPYYYSDFIPLKITAQDDFNVSKIVVQTALSKDKNAVWTDTAVIENTGNGQYFHASHNLELTDFKDGNVYVRAYAIDSAENKGDVSAVYEYIVDKTVPDAPVSLESSADASEIQLMWQAHENKEDSVGFSLYRSTEKDGEYTKILDNANVLNFYDRNAEIGKTYYYCLTAIDAAGNESEKSKAVSAVLADDTVNPEIVSISPADNSMVSNVCNEVSVLVKDNVKIKSVTMEYRISEDDKYTSFLNLEDVNNYSTVAKGKLPRTALTGEKVYVRVKTADAQGNESGYSQVTYIINNDVTEILTAESEQLEDCVKVTWTAKENKSTQGYYIYRKINTGSWTKIAAVTADSVNEGKYTHNDFGVRTAGTVTYKIESASISRISDTLQTESIQVYTNPEAALDVETVQQQNVEYIFDASACNDYYGITDISIDYGDGCTDSEDSAESAKFIHKYTETGKYNVTVVCTNEQGLTSSFEQAVEVIERALMGEATVSVKTTEGKPASGIYVYVDIGTDRQKKLKTDNSGNITFRTAAGIHSIGVYGEGYLPAEKDCTILAGSGNKIDFTVVEEDIVTADFTVERMTLDEIVAAGIDITAPENQHIVEVKLDVEYKVHNSPSASLTYYVNGNGAVVGGGGWGGSWTGGGWTGGTGGNSGGSVTKPVYISLNEENEVETVIMLTVPVSASFLKEFFHAQLTIYNNADEQFTISENEIELMLPDGLTLVDVEASDNKIVTYDIIEGQSSRTIDWIIRGDEAGEYELSASYHGVLDRFNESIDTVFSADEPIVVYGETAVSVEVNVPEMLFDNQFIFEVAMTNNCPVDVYCPSTDTGTVISSAFGNSGGAKPVIYQRRLMKDGKYIRIIGNDEVFDTLEPGYTYSVVYKASGVFTGIDGEGKNKFHSSRLDLIKASIEVLNGSKIPVTLNVVEMIEAIILNEIKTIPGYEPQKQFTVMVTSSDTKQFLDGAVVKMGSVTKNTGSGGYVVMDIPEEPQSFTVSCAGYKSRTIQPDESYDDGLYIVDLEPEAPVDKNPGSAVEGNNDYGYIPIPDDINGDPEDDTNEITSLPCSLTLGEDLELEFADDFPLVGGMGFSISGLDLPAEIEFDEEGNVGFQIGLADIWKKELSTDDNKDNSSSGNSSGSGSGSGDSSSSGNSSGSSSGSDDNSSSGNSSGSSSGSGDNSSSGNSGNNNSTDTKEECDLVKKYRELVEFARKYPTMGDYVKDAKNIGASANPFNKTAKGSLEAELSLVAGLKGKFDPAKGFKQSVIEDGINIEGYIALTFEIECGFETQLVVVSIPVAIEVTLGAEMNVGVNFSMTYKDSEFSFGGNLKLEGEVEAEIFAGVGATGICAAGVYGSAGLGIEYTFVSSNEKEKGLNKITFTYDVGVKAYVGPFEVSKSIKSPDEDIVLYDQEKKNATKSNGGGAKRSSNQFLADIYEQSNYILADEINLKSAGIWKGASKEAIESAEGCAELLTLIDNASGVTMHKLAVVGDDLVLIYLDNDSDRIAVNAMRLMYTVYDTAEKKWSTPTQLDNNKTGDYAPSIATIGTELYVVYQDTAKVLDEKAEIDSWLATQNIAFAKYDAKTKKFGEVAYITKDSTVLDSAPVIAVGEDKIAAAWISNEENDYFGTNNKNCLMYSELSISGWSEPEILLSNLGPVTDIEAGMVNDRFCAVYVTDNDNDLVTREDRTLNVRRYGENESYEIDNGDICSVRFADSHETGEQALYWYGNSTIRMTDNLTAARDVFDNNIASISSAFDIAGNRIIWATGDGENKSNLFETVYDASSKSWSGAVRLTAQNMYIESVEAVEYGEKVISVMNRNNVTITDDDIITDNSIVWTSFAAVNNIRAEGAYFMQCDYEAGKALPVNVYVTNNGESTVNSVTVDIISADGKKCGSKTFEGEFRSGETKEFIINVDTTTAGASDKLTVNVSSTIEENNTDDNSIVLDYQFADMSAEAVKTDDNTLAVTVTNNGNAESPAKLAVYDYASNEQLDVFDIEKIGAGSAVTKNIDLTAYLEKCESNIKVRVICDGDTNDAANSCVVFSAMDNVTDIITGDVNDDITIDASDASKVLEEYAAMSTGNDSLLNDKQKKAADVNDDGKIDSSDASKILEYYASASTGGNPSFD